MLSKLTLLSVVGALETTGDAYKWNMTCAQCIVNNEKFCHDEYDKGMFTLENAPVQEKQVCCALGEDCPTDNGEYSIDSWGAVCSSNYKSKALSLLECPFIKDYCGDRQNFDFKDVNDEKQTITLSAADMKGNSCTYRISSKCGAPSFKLMGSKDQSSKFNIEIVEYTESNFKDEDGYSDMDKVPVTTLEHCKDAQNCEAGGLISRNV
jgi:hypothetical protein